MWRLLTSVALLLTFCGEPPQRSVSVPAAPPPIRGRSEPADIQTLAPKAAALMAITDRAHLYRVAMPFTKETTIYAGRPKVLDEYSIISERDLTVDETREARNLILDSTTFNLHDAMGCMFSPAYVLEFREAGRIVDLVICFKCRDVLIRSTVGENANTVLANGGRNTKRLYELLTSVIPL